MVANFYIVIAYLIFIFGGGPCVIVVLKGPHAQKGPN